MVAMIKPPRPWVPSTSKVKVAAIEHIVHRPVKIAFDEMGGDSRRIILRQVQAGHEILQFLVRIGQHFIRNAVGFQPGFVSNMISVHELDFRVGEKVQRGAKSMGGKIGKIGRDQDPAIVGARAFFHDQHGSLSMVNQMIHRRTEEEVGNIIMSCGTDNDQVAVQLLRRFGDHLGWLAVIYRQIAAFGISTIVAQQNRLDFRNINLCLGVAHK